MGLQFKLIFSFYRKFIWISLLLNVIFIGLQISFVPATVYKVVLTLLIFWTYRISGKGQQLIFYNNLKITSGKLFSISFAYDLFLLITTYSIFGRLS